MNDEQTDAAMREGMRHLAESGGLPVDSVSIPMWIVRGALLCAAKEDLRHYITCVNFDFRAGQVAGTDGHILFVARIPKSDRDTVLIDRGVLEIALKSGSAAIEIGINQIEANNLPCGLVFKPVDHAFPKYAGVVPKKCSGLPGQFNPELLARGRHALSTVSPQLPVLEYNGPDGGAVMSIPGIEAFCVIMPFRSDGLGASRDWFYE